MSRIGIQKITIEREGRRTVGQIGRWIDTLGDKERDAIIMHPDPTYDGQMWWDSALDCGCLVGCVIGKKRAAVQLVPVCDGDRFSALVPPSS
jgi:hypothetical protein